MEEGIIKAADRHTTRRIRMLQGNAIRALVELISNSDDSYIRLEEEQKPASGLIEVLYEKKGYRGHFAVRDYAEGMSIDDVRRGFKEYGAATSGMKTGRGVRGYFGQGAKDALAGMVDGRICTFKDDMYIECSLYIEEGKAHYKIIEPIPASLMLRKEHGIEANGTVAYFCVDPKITTSSHVPQFSTVHEELANNYLLRKIMANRQRKIVLIDKNGESRRLRYQFPEAKDLLSETFVIKFGTYEGFPVSVTILRADKELTQSGDSRDGGLLLVDDKDAVLGVSLFRFDSEPLAAHLFGEVRIGNFRELLESEEPVLSEEREGINVRHPFCRKLIPELENRIETIVKEEKLRRQKEEQSKIDREEIARFRKAFSILNEIAEKEAQAAVNLGQETTDNLDDPPDGFCLYPSSAQVTVGKRYVIELRLNTRVVRYGSAISIVSTHPRIRVFNNEIIIRAEDGVGIIQKFITIEANEPNIEGVIKASTTGKYSQTRISVIPEKRATV